MRVTFCLAVLSLAVGGAGFGLAASGNTVLGPPSALVLNSCRDVASLVAEQSVRLNVYCPPLVPRAPGIRRDHAGSLRSGKEMELGYALSFSSRIAGGENGWGRHWTLDVGRPAAVRRLRQPFPQSPQELIRIRKRDVGVYRIEEGIRSFYAGHVVYAWQENSLRFHLTVHGHQWETRLRQMTSALMAAIDQCTPARTTSFCSKVVLRPRS